MDRVEMIAPSEATWILASFCALHGKSVNHALLAKQCVAPLRLAEFESLPLSLGLAITLERRAWC